MSSDAGGTHILDEEEKNNQAGCLETDLQEVKKSLSDGDLENAKTIIRDILSREENSYELIAVLSQFITSEIYNVNRELFECCESLLEEICSRCFAEEALLELIEQAEDCEPIAFTVMLRAMMSCLQRIHHDKLSNPMEWCLNTVLRHVYQLTPPDDIKPEGEEELTLADNSENVTTIANSYANIIEFFKMFKSRDENLKESTLSCLLKLFGEPLVYTDLSSGGKSKSECRLHAESLLGLVLHDKLDPLRFLKFVNNSTQKDSVQAFVDADYVNTSLAVFYYLVFHEELYLDLISHVYSPIFIVFQLLTLCLTLLSYSHSCIQKKGLMLARSVISRLAERSVNYAAIESYAQILAKFVESLAGIMIYCEVKEHREMAVKIFKSTILKLDDRGRYVMMVNVQQVITQPGFVGYLATILKDTIAESLASTRPSEFFRGKHLRNLLTKFCNLDEGVKYDVLTYDLIEQSDRILSLLNLLRYLALRDLQNVTGFWDWQPYLTKHFLEPLKKGIMLSRDHYQFYKTKLQSDTDGSVDIMLCHVSMPKEQKDKVLNLALNTFDLMESLLSRLNECIVLHKTEHDSK